MEGNSAYEEIEAEFVALEERLADPELLADRDAYAAAARQYKELEVKAVRIRALRGHREDIEVATEMLAEADAAERGLLEAEINQAAAAVEELEVELAELMVPKDPNDGKNVIVEIKGAEGGEEANLFARDLFDMYEAYAGQHRWDLEMMNAQGSDMGGYTDVVFMLRGNDVWRKMKYEGGPIECNGCRSPSRRAGSTPRRPLCRCCPKPRRWRSTLTRRISRSMSIGHRGRGDSR